MDLELCLFELTTGRLVAVNPLLVRFLRDDGGGEVTIVFTESHEIVVKGAIADVIDKLQRTPA